MQTKQLGNSDLKLTPIGVGAWAMGGSGWAFAWGPQDDDDSISAIRAALDRGVNHIGVLAYSPMKSGLLSGVMTRERVAALPADDFRRRTPNFQEPLLSRNLELVELLREIGARHGRSPGEVAIAWVLRRPEVTAAIVG